MEQGSRSLMIILCVALVLGALVVGFHPAYRNALLAIAGGHPAESPIWQANRDYYPDVSLPAAPTDEAPAAAEAAPDAAN